MKIFFWGTTSLEELIYKTLRLLLIAVLLKLWRALKKYGAWMKAKGEYSRIMLITRPVQVTKKASQTLSPPWFPLQMPHCHQMNVLNNWEIRKYALVLFTSLWGKKKKELTSLYNRNGSQFFPIEHIQILRLQAMLTFETWELLQSYLIHFRGHAKIRQYRIRTHRSRYFGLTWGPSLAPSSSVMLILQRNHF